MPIPQAAHYMNCPLHELPITGGLLYILTDVQVSGWKETEDEDEEGQESGTVFEDVDLTELEWADYDERSGESTVISEIEVKFVTVK